MNASRIFSARRLAAKDEAHAVIGKAGWLVVLGFQDGQTGGRRQRSLADSFFELVVESSLAVDYNSTVPAP